MKSTIADAFRIIRQTYGSETAIDLNYKFNVAQENFARANAEVERLKSLPNCLVAELDAANQVLSETKEKFDKIVSSIRDLSQT